MATHDGTARAARQMLERGRWRSAIVSCCLYTGAQLHAAVRKTGVARIRIQRGGMKVATATVSELNPAEKVMYSAHNGRAYF